MKGGAGEIAGTDFLPIIFLNMKIKEGKSVPVLN
jgi:hypothetical protein